MTILETLGSGLPVLALQFAVTLVLLALGAMVYMLMTPFHERDLIRQGNVAAGLVLAGTLVSLALPLAATLATSTHTLDIVLWGLVALAIQLAAFRLAAALLPGLREMIEGGNAAAACTLTGIQLAVALLNAGAMAG
jgi:putative membrane protein